MFFFGFSSRPEAKDGKGLFANNKSPIGHLFPDGNHYRLGVKHIFTQTATGNLKWESKGHHVYVPHHYESSQSKRTRNAGITNGCVKTHEYAVWISCVTPQPHHMNTPLTSSVNLRHFLHCVTLAS